MTQTSDLLFEIGCEELPASFVDAALRALPELAARELAALRLEHGPIRALGTPRRLSVLVGSLARQQPDLEETVTGPPVKAAFKDGEPTKAASAFAAKLGCSVAELERVQTPKGEYLCGVRREAGRPTAQLLAEALTAIASSIPFRKSMRWGDGDIAFGRPLRWLLALFGTEPITVQLGNLLSGKCSFGHRFLHPSEVAVSEPAGYVAALREARVIVDPTERRELMVARLQEAARAADGVLIEDDFLVGENLSLVEEPQVVVGSFDEVFLSLPDEVILEVARGHQRYFGLRAADGRLLPKYLAVVNTAENPDKIRLGNDRVMRARLADARFFHEEDLKHRLEDRRQDLAGIVFQNRLGSVLEKVTRIEKLAAWLGRTLGLPADVVEAATRGAALCKCDLVTWMVGEFPELQGEVGRAYALRQGVPPEVADVIRDHYRPKGASDATASSAAAALVALADRLDTLVGCFALGLSPTGGADPYGLRRACLGVLRTLLDHSLDLELSAAFAAAYGGYASVELDLDETALGDKLSAFFRDRLRGLLTAEMANDAVDAALGAGAERPLDARARAAALLELDDATRRSLGEVFKRATNIAKTAPEGEPQRGPEPAEQALHDAFVPLRDELATFATAGNYTAAFARLASLAPLLRTYFDQVMVMAEEEELRTNRLRLMRTISDTCGALARLELLGEVSESD